MSKLTTIIITALAFYGTAYANDVYIDQAGSSSNIDITQTGSGNRVGSSSERTTILGTGGDDIDITQTGSSNEIDIETGSAASSQNIDIVQDGSNNIVDINMGSVADAEIDLNIDGDSNTVGICGTLTTAAGAGTAAACDADMAQDDFGVDVDIVGNGNQIGIARSSVGTAGVTEVTLDVTGASNYVNVVQETAGIVNMTIDGSSNGINITQSPSP